VKKFNFLHAFNCTTWQLLLYHQWYKQSEKGCSRLCCRGAEGLSSPNHPKVVFAIFEALHAFCRKLHSFGKVFLGLVFVTCHFLYFFTLVKKSVNVFDDGIPVRILRTSGVCRIRYNNTSMYYYKVLPN